jgi:hypothetical protein
MRLRDNNAVAGHAPCVRRHASRFPTLSAVTICTLMLRSKAAQPQNLGILMPWPGGGGGPPENELKNLPARLPIMATCFSGILRLSPQLHSCMFRFGTWLRKFPVAS